MRDPRTCGSLSVSVPGLVAPRPGARPRGTWLATLTMGDAAGAHDQMGVFLEGARADTVTTARGQFYTRTYRIEVADGQLTLLLDDLGGTDANVAIAAIEVR